MTLVAGCAVLWWGNRQTDRRCFPKRDMAEKPIGPAREVMYLVTMGSVVCDPFAGSRALLVAAKEVRHQWMGCELGLVNLDIAMARVEPALLVTASQRSEFKKIHKRSHSRFPRLPLMAL
ncbi:site-specific DNA-methyltransferase [Ralstonia pseudosolanacearum]|uniref:DNA methylase N-4/N-6 domain-containing protein n=2 Tax=root TaxID=1 RepID=A0A077K824_9CAUD|nr:site-specific DNA-methyltransferase [Ralstonia phage RSY1]TXD86126.1 site-specific DNA-methyltransferase [Ralstonia pseudosolanacearum]BAP28136.1 hypothetical protein [Ralstonia phage RSY1]BCM02203.1 hypothetical protein MAFF301560_15900 [Ralstonia solanacearum]BEU47044.1 hypothetical protein MAFF211519_23690 [Ralstonia pseudosolanacearum]